MSLENVYESGRTIRYHTNPNMNHLGQTVADHTWGMIAMLFFLHSNPSLQLIGYVTFHDSEERWIGDVPYPFKKAAPDLVKQHEAVGQIICRQMGIPRFQISEEEKVWVKLLDRLEAYQFAKLHDKLTPSWAPNNQAIINAAIELDIEEKIKCLMITPTE